jgi:hypothetical protein
VVSEAERAQYVNGEPGENLTQGTPGGYQDVVSDDEYWFVDPDLREVSQGPQLFGLGRDLTDDE